MIVSCIPLVNPFLLNVAKKMDIPLLVVTTDIDISAFCYGFTNENSPNLYNRFRITVPFGKESWDPLFLSHIPAELQSSLQYGFAYPTRHAFSENFDESTLNEIRKDYQIQKDENVILVMMGGNTARAALRYAKLLLDMTKEDIGQIVGKENNRKKIRMICLCGDVTQKANRNLMTKLNGLNQSPTKQNDLVIIHAAPATSRIAELVSLPELFTVISKPGGSTVNEMIKKKIPMVYHISKVVLSWEKGNMEYGLSRDLGRSFQIHGKMDEKVRKALTLVLADTFSLHKNILEGKRSVPDADLFDFTKNLRVTVKEMLSSKKTL